MKKFLIFKTISFKSLLVIIILFIVLIILFWGGAKHLKSWKTVEVKPGVTCLGEDVSGLQEEELTLVVGRKAQDFKKPPVDASLEPVTGGVITEINGVQMDIECTVKRILEAYPGEEVSPVFISIEPQITMEDYPKAPLYRGNPDKKQIAFLINVAWGNEYIEEMLEVLDRYQVSCTFFFVGKWAEKNPELVRQIVSRGHEAANHGYSDSVLMSQLSPEEMERDIEKTNHIVRELTGVNPVFFSSHCGELNEDLLEACGRLNMRMVMWSLDTVDWKLPGAEVMAEKILAGAHNGATVLMHPTEQTPAALEIMIPGLQEQGFTLVSLSRLIDPDYH